MPIDFDSIDYKINSFLDFWEKSGRDPDELRVDNWQIHTPGCAGDFGCCSKSYDLATLVDALYELTGRKEPPFKKKERRDAETDPDSNCQADAVETPPDGDVPAGA
ncbi:hypothetical protein LCGC14_0259110 [marine sediment metagenome]|uniref:Uncharacterized protein n=1 Tax=marine sediment metagenome TaxID=412755 RepID=A0A0F9WMV9_9ZZZZ